MPYIGSSASPLPVNFAAVQAQSFNGTGSQTAFTLNRTIPGVTAIEVLVNNVQQSPYDGSYSVSGTTLTFSEAPSAGTSNVYVVYRDQAIGSLVDESAYRKAEAVAKAGDTMTGALALPAGGLNVGSGQLAVDASGRVTMPYQPAFSVAKVNDPNQIASGVYIFNEVSLNRGGHYSTSTGRFTAPVAGAYYFIASLQLYGGSAAYCRFQKNGADLFTNGSSGPVYEDGPDLHETVTFAAVIDLAVNDYVTVERNSTTRGMQSSLSGYFIG